MPSQERRPNVRVHALDTPRPDRSMLALEAIVAVVAILSAFALGFAR